jgi:hypothetical protein
MYQQTPLLIEEAEPAKVSSSSRVGYGLLIVALLAAGTVAVSGSKRSHSVHSSELQEQTAESELQFRPTVHAYVDAL